MDDLDRYLSFVESMRDLRSIINNRLNNTPSLKFKVATDEEYPGTKLVWNVPADNVMMMINPKGTIFMRPTSKYFEALSANRQVIEHTGLNDFRGRISSSQRRRWYFQYYVDKNTKIITKGGSKIVLDLGKKEDLRHDVFLQIHGSAGFTVRAAMSDYYRQMQIGPRQFVTIRI